MLDKSVPYHPLYFVRPPEAPLPEAHLPEGFFLRPWAPGLEADWAAIETAVDEFPNIDVAKKRFALDFGGHPERLPRRLFFIQAPDGQLVGNCAAWWQVKDQIERPLLHYLAVLPAFQKLGLGRVLVHRVLQAFEGLYPGEAVYLGTQTWSWPAICLYLDFGFRLTNETDVAKALPYLQQRMPADCFRRLLDSRMGDR